MRGREINGAYHLIVPDNVADWDAPSDWERERIGHMISTLRPSDVLFDIGVEHGWISGLLAKYATNRMVLVEPSPEFWPNINLTWVHNQFPQPIACFPGFVGEESAFLPSDVYIPPNWPPQVQGPECGAMAYRYLHADHHHAQGIPIITIDDLAEHVGPPTAITMDIEGAELGALCGANFTLTVHKPLVWVSVHPDLMTRDYGTDPVELHAFMETLDYRGVHLATDHEEHWFFYPLEKRARDG